MLFLPRNYIKVVIIYETIRILGKRLQKAVDSLAVLFGKPSFETLTKELEPLSERYDYVFRMNHVENMIRSLS